MPLKLHRITISICLGLIGCMVSAGQLRQEGKGTDLYTITTKVRLAEPYDVKAMNDEFQTAKLLSEKDGVGTFEITYRPFHIQEVGSDSNWKTHDQKMVEYLKPRPCANWDASLRAQILKDLQSDGIDPDRLDDRTLVQKVSSWALKRSKFNEQFGLWMVDFVNGKPYISPEMEGPFRSNEPQGMTQSQIFDRELFGKAMYYNKTHGACTSSSTYLTTILRAIGIPTRIILTVPACDFNDPTQVKMLVGAIRHHQAAHAIRIAATANGFVNHVYNEVWVAGKWVRLNYNKLGQPILDSNYCGLMTHVYTARDVSEVPFSKTWGARFGLDKGPKLSSVNPYQLVAAKDNLAPGAILDNPVVEVLNSVTVTAILRPGDPNLPSWVKFRPEDDAFFQIKEWIAGQNYKQLREFVSDAGTTFTLAAAGAADVTAVLSGLNVSDEHGGFQAFGVKLNSKLQPGVSYSIKPRNEGHTHKWAFPSNVVWKG